jgi:hypothetical protein
MARIDIKSSSTGGGGSGTVTSVAVSSTTLTVTGSPITSSGTITANIPDGYLKVGTGVTGSLQNVVDTNGTATQLFLSSTAIQATSKIQITTAETSYIDAEDSSGNNRFTVGRDPSSQLVTVDFASVPTALTTPVGAIRTATDGVTLANVMTFLENGSIGLNTDTPGSKFDVHSSGAIVAQFNKTVSGNSYIQQLMAGTARWKHGFTSSTGAFDIIDDVNSLTRLSVLNTGQLKLNAYTSTSAFTGTTAGFLAFDASGNILSVTSPATSPAGTTGAVQFNNAGAFGADSTQLFWDDANNRLGDGTATPTAKLHIVGNGSTSATTSLLVHNSSGNTGLQVTDDQQVTGYSGTQIRFKLGVTSAGQGISTRDGEVAFGFIDANNSAAIRLLATGTGSSYIDGYTEGSGKAQNYPLFIGSRANNTGSATTGSTTQENGTRTIFGSAVSDASALVQINSTTRGFLPPRMTTAEKNAIATPAAGLMVYDTTLNKLCVRTAAAWETITSI